jgi:hypothetical protein
MNYDESFKTHREWKKLTTIGIPLMPRGKRLMLELNIGSPSLYPMQQLSTTNRAPVNSHVASVAATKAATKEMVDLYNSSPESTEREETSTASPDLML